MRGLLARIEKLEQAAGSHRTLLLCIWGKVSDAEMRQRIRERAEQERVPESCIQVLNVGWIGELDELSG